MKKETQEWLKIADEEYKAATHLYKRELFRMVCYHSQQTAEKLLKAALTEKEVSVARTHNILDLRNAVAKAGYKLKLLDEDAVFLNSVYRSRYPSDLGLLPGGEPTKNDAQKALKIAGTLMKWMKRHQRKR